MDEIQQHYNDLYRETAEARQQYENETRDYDVDDL